ncbi:MAG TPA: glycosyltransferase family 9 protein [Holophaga sp.]|nr:glycosyltransferase family 9 protein [Holophaga sp.]
MNVPEQAIWIRFPRFFGDAMMIHAAIAPLRASGVPLIAWGPAWILDLVEGSSDYAACVADPGRKYSPFEAAKLLRSHRPRAVVNFPKSLRPAIAAWLARVPLRLGCADGGGWLFYTHSERFYAQDTPFVERYASVVRKAFPEFPEAPFTPFRPRKAALDQVAEERQQLGLKDYVALGPGANAHNKRLPVRTFIELGRRLEACGLKVVILGGKGDDQVLAHAICEGLPTAIDRSGQGGLAYSAAWIAGARAMVGVDSGLAHIAGASGIPTLGVFGPTRPRHSAPWGPKVRTIRLEGLSCLECMAWSCSVEGHPCMENLDMNQMWEAVRELLG